MVCPGFVARVPNLTLTFGLRQTILQTPWETHGQQVAPTVDTHAWYKHVKPRPCRDRFLNRT